MTEQADRVAAAIGYVCGHLGEIRDTLVDHGVRAPWTHQAHAAELAHAGQDVVVATGTASGKSLAYQLPVLSAFAADPRATALYLSALAAAVY